MANEYGRKASSSGAESAGIGRRDPKSCIKCLGGSSAKLVATTDNPEWTKRFGQRIDNARLPNDEAERTELALVIGRDGHYLLEQIYATSEQLEYLQQIPAVETLRQVWIQQYCWQEGQLEWRMRHKHGMAPAAITIISPYDLEARYGHKRTLTRGKINEGIVNLTSITVSKATN